MPVENPKGLKKMKRGCSNTKEREGERLGIVFMMYLSPYSSSQFDC